MLEQIWKKYGLYDYLQEDLQQIRTQRERNLLYPKKNVHRIQNDP